MNLNDSEIVVSARRILDESLCSLAPDGAPTPFMVAVGPHGMQHVGLHAMSDPDFAQTAETVIPAFIVLNEPVELALTAFIDDPEVCGSVPECALIAYWGASGRTLFTSLVTRRKTQPPVLAGWLKAPASASLGSLDEGVHSGLDMARRILSPAAHDLRERINMIRLTAATEDTDTLPLTVDALRDWQWLA